MMAIRKNLPYVGLTFTETHVPCLVINLVMKKHILVSKSRMVMALGKVT